jgi:hypothetical protein
VYPKKGNKKGGKVGEDNLQFQKRLRSSRIIKRSNFSQNRSLSSVVYDLLYYMIYSCIFVAQQSGRYYLISQKKKKTLRNYFSSLEEEQIKSAGRGGGGGRERAQKREKKGDITKGLLRDVLPSNCLYLASKGLFCNGIVGQSKAGILSAIKVRRGKKGENRKEIKKS